MSQTLTLTGRGNAVSVDYFPPIVLNPKYDYVLGLVGFYGCNSVRNVTQKNNKFHIGDTVLTIPPGAYEIDEISRYLKEHVKENLTLKANNNTLRVELQASQPVDFTKDGTIGRMLGFSAKILTVNQKHESDLNVEIIKATNIHVETNITSGAYRNATLSHTIFEFDLSVEPGYRLVKEPSTIIYLPINVRSIDNITLKLVDQDSTLVDFGTEAFTVRLELKQHGPRSE